MDQLSQLLPFWFGMVRCSKGRTKNHTNTKWLNERREQREALTIKKKKMFEEPKEKTNNETIIQKHE